MGAQAIKLRAARETDLPRLKTLWRASFPDCAADTYFFEHCFVPGHVESSLVLLMDGKIQSMVFFLPTFWYDEAHGYGPAPCLVGLATDPDCRRRQYASWLVETACDFMVEKGAGGIWTMLPDDTLELFFFPCRAFGRCQELRRAPILRRSFPKEQGDFAGRNRRNMSGSGKNCCRGKTTS